MSEEAVTQELTTQTVILATKAQARARAGLIKTAAENLGVLLFEAHEAEDWRVLGYETWRAYLEAEFSIGIRRVNQLVTEGRINKALAGSGSGVRVTAREAQSIAKGNAFPDSTYITDAATGLPDVTQIERTVTERREQVVTKRHAKKGYRPPTLDGYLKVIDEAIEKVTGAAEMTEGEILQYLDHDARRNFERTVTRMADFVEEWSARLSAPAEPIRIDEWESA